MSSSAGPDVKQCGTGCQAVRDRMLSTGEADDKQWGTGCLSSGSGILVGIIWLSSGETVCLSSGETVCWSIGRTKAENCMVEHWKD